MEIFLDSFDLNAIEEYIPYIKGITTNPSIMAKFCKNKEDFKNTLIQMQKKFPDLLINLQVQSNTAKEMIEDAKKIIQLNENFIVKVPLSKEGSKALKEISKMGVKTNATLCFSLFQAQLAQDYGATYISPFIGRMEDASVDIVQFMQNLRKVLTTSKLLAASIRNIRHVELATKVKSDAITLNEKVFASIFGMDLLKDGLEIFQKANDELSII